MGQADVGAPLPGISEPGGGIASLCCGGSREVVSLAGLVRGGLQMPAARCLDWLGSGSAMAAAFVDCQQRPFPDFAGDSDSESGIEGVEPECEACFR